MQITASRLARSGRAGRQHHLHRQRHERRAGRDHERAHDVILNNTLLWQSMTVPAGWTCPSLAVGHGASFTCTAANFGLTTSIVHDRAQGRFRAVRHQQPDHQRDLHHQQRLGRSEQRQQRGGRLDAIRDAARGHADHRDRLARSGGAERQHHLHRQRDERGPGCDDQRARCRSSSTTRCSGSRSRVPAGWSCPALAVGHGASFTCTAANLA